MVKLGSRGVVNTRNSVAEFAWGCPTNARRVPRSSRTIPTNTDGIV
jgi:hypothetical protein